MAFSLSGRIVRIVLVRCVAGAIGGAVIGSLFEPKPKERRKGFPADLAAAKADYDRACTLAPKFAACSFAKELAEAMGKPECVPADFTRALLAGEEDAMRHGLDPAFRAKINGGEAARLGRQRHASMFARHTSLTRVKRSTTMILGPSRIDPTS